MKNLKIIFICTLLCVSLKSNAFHAKIILVIPEQTKLYVNDILLYPQPNGTYIITLGKAKTLNLRYEKEGYNSKTMVFIYSRDSKVIPNITFYNRGVNYYSVELIKK